MLLFLMTVAVMMVIMLNITIYDRPAYQMQTLYFCPMVASFFFLFSSPYLSHRRLDFCHTCTHDVASANLGCRSETCCTRLAENTAHKYSQKFAVWAPLHNFVGLYLHN